MNLQGVADEFAAIMGELEPQYSWVGVVRERQLSDRQSDTTASVGRQDSGVVLEHSDLFVRWNPAASNYNGFDQAA